MPVKTIESFEEFRSVVTSGNPVVIDFWAPWCGPCRVISPVFEKFSEAGFEHVGFYKVNVDEQGQIAEEVGIRAMPTFSVFHSGQKINELTGANPHGLESLVQSAAQV